MRLVGWTPIALLFAFPCRLPTGRRLQIAWQSRRVL